jgi:prepilin-type N-terminal cleavage/methylation domain-containing protein
MWTKNKKGFTLAELLIVVAIIGVLVAISIPIFSSQLEKSREATDLANVRGA